VQTAVSQSAGANIYAAANGPDTSNSSSLPAFKTTGGDDSIVTFEQLEMPIEMEMEFSRLQPKGVLLFRDEFQQMHNGMLGEAIRTLKVWFIDDHIIGYTLEKPFDAAGGKIKRQKINIPVTWCCTPAIEGHTQHCAITLAEVHADETANKCTGWHIKLPPPIKFQAPVKLQKVKKRKKKNTGDGSFGHVQTTTGKAKQQKKKKDKKKGFEQPVIMPDSTGTKAVKDSI
ncbi:MAG TPA: hypothetical protein VHB48_10910, partial [Chitinophagaceae bacterium]|nr:hypothetical protein [Chitinophagaceae bacterium]